MVLGAYEEHVLGPRRREKRELTGRRRNSKKSGLGTNAA